MWLLNRKVALHVRFKESFYVSDLKKNEKKILKIPKII